MKSRLLGAVCLYAFSFIHTSSNAATFDIFSDRLNFMSSVGNTIIDDYENPNYEHVMTDAAMSAVLGESTYYTYGGEQTDYNNIMQDGFGVDASKAYCSLCNGNFQLSFGNTSLSHDGGIYGAGIDITQNTSGTVDNYTYSATITFIDGSANIIGLPHVPAGFPNPAHQFWGITSDTGISSIDFIGYANSGPNRTFFIMDNLTIAASSVPIPPAVWLFGSGLIGLVGVARRKLA